MFSEETDIIVKLKAKDEKCMQMLFDHYYHALCTYALKYLPALQDAEDVVQNVLVSFWENKRGQQFEGSVRPYLFGAVTKASLKLLERRGRIVFDDIELYVDRFLEETLWYEDEELNLLKAKLKKEIDRLPEKSREVFNAIVLESLSYKQVAERYHISLNTVKTHYSHALKKLRDNLGDIFIILLCMS